MNLKWCAFTGALMAGFVALTFIHKEAAQDPPGVTTRWWDGTTQSVEQHYWNGKLQARTEYGDDGKTVVAFREWSEAGILVHEKVRLKNGRLDEKYFAEDGKTLIQHTLWNGDEKFFLARRNFYPDGKVKEETIMTEDGTVAAEKRTWDINGQLVVEATVLKNADQQTDNFVNGKIVRRTIVTGKLDVETITFHDNGQVARRHKQIRLNQDEFTEIHNKEGQLVLKREQSGDTGATRVEVFEGGKLKLLQNFAGFRTGGGKSTIEEYDTVTGKVGRRIVLNRDFSLEVQRFRKDGTLEQVKYLDERLKVLRSKTYDASGKEVVEEKEGGEPEVIEDKLLNDASYFITIGE